jgi:DNA-binding HxlR family transcriptional regulator
MALLDLLGRRAALRILWELRDRRLNFRALIEAAGTNPGVLNTRLKQLRDAHLVERGSRTEGYGLTEHGESLLAVFLPLDAWATDWAKLFERKAGKQRRSLSPLAGRGSG